MPRNLSRAARPGHAAHLRRAAIATAVAALATALTGQATALGAAGGGAASATKSMEALPAGSARTAGSAQTTSPKAASLKHNRLITLVTGDRAVVDAKGEFVGLQRAKGRERIPVQVRTVAGHTLVIPLDAATMIASGTLDRRLFDLTELAKSQKSDGRLKVIVGYKGTSARGAVRDSASVSATFASLGADALRTTAEDAPQLWDAVTDGAKAAPGVSHVWLDGVRKASLDKSVPQIGAPAAWAKGYTGKGVKVAVLDTGVDTSHPDLKSQVAAAKNFTSAKDTTDHFGHGTHVASIIAGTGAKSSGKYKGVAPDAKLLNAKVLADDGSGDDSSILAGMEWAAAQGADIVNLSLGGTDTPGVDPLEAEVNKLSETKGILFAIAAGNEGEGGAGTLDSPGSAADALTVGAVDGSDKLAYFSSRGPSADDTLKPDVTAPGVDITAASAAGSVIAKHYGENPAGYVTISGTSMATPHVAGAAALLKQEHPDWTFAQLKATLISSAKGGDYAGYQGGAGRIQVDKAIGQNVLAEPSSVDFPVQQWPHSANTPVTKQLTYRNSGTKDVTLKLALQSFDPQGKAAAAGFFTLGAQELTVPAGGSAAVGVTVNAKLGGDVDGGYSARVTASGDGQTVSTVVGAVRETEHYDVTFKYVNRPGQTLSHLESFVGLDSAEPVSYLSTEHTDTTSTIRVPKGTYMMESASAKDLKTYAGGLDWLIAPKLTIDKDQTITLDLNTAKSPDITVPDPKAKPLNAWVSYKYYPGANGQNGNGVLVPSFSDVRLAHVGPAVDGVSQTWSGQWSAGANTEYDTVAAATVKKIKGGDYVKHYKAGDFATLKAGLGASVPGRTGAVALTSTVPDGLGFRYGYADVVPQRLPSTRTYRVSAVEGAQWRPDFYQYTGKKDANGGPATDVSYSVDDYLTLKPGATYEQRFNTAVFGPRMSGAGLYRDGDQLYGMVSLFSDGARHSGSSDILSATTVLYRDGKKVGANSDPLTGEKQFKVPAGDASYRLTASVRRGSKVSAAGTRIDTSWTFRSKRPTDGLPAQLPASSVRFAAPTALDSTVAAGRTVTYPVAVEGAGAGRNLKSLSVWASYDQGKSWQKVTVTGGKVTLRNPAKGKSVSLRATVVDKKGNMSTVTVFDAYFGK